MTWILDILNRYPVLAEIAILIGFGLLGLLLHFVLKRFILRGLYMLFCQTRVKWDQILYEQGAFANLPNLIPPIIVYQSIPFLPLLGSAIYRITSLWITVIVVLFLDRFLSALLFLYNQLPIAARRPMKGYTQVTKLVIYITAAIIAMSILSGQAPWYLLSGLGALTAVLLVVFRDTILSFVASLQLTGNDLVRIGDWIEMPKYDANGAVIEMALHTIKVRNWDNTITMIPMHKVLEDSFKNWRGMAEAGGRQIQRSVLIDQTSVRFCDEDMLAYFRSIYLLRDYLAEKEAELAAYNEKNELGGHRVNSRRLTNLGVFRVYLAEYLKRHPQLHKGMFSMVRQLQPTKEGIPLEVFVFSNETTWVSYENIQSDIFDHILAVVPEFGLRIFQEPSGADLKDALNTYARER